MVTRLMVILLSALVATSPAGAIDVNGELKKAQLEKLSADPTGSEARVYYNTTSKKAKLYNGTSWGELGGAGSGEKNYITGSSSATGWTCVGDLAVATTTTAADLPRENTTASGVKITADADTQSTADYCYHDFTLDDVDLGKKLKLEWAQKTTGTFVAGDLEVIVTTQADRTTALATPSLTSIPALDFVFPSSFDTTTTATLSLVVRATTDMATDGGVVISDVIVGPSAIVQGYPGSGPHAWTPTGTWVSNTTYGGVYYRDGSKLSGKFYVSVTGAPTATGLNVDLPSGLTIDSSAFATNASYTIGRGWVVDASTSARYSATATIHPTLNYMTLRVDAQSANTVTAIDRVDTNITSTVPTTFASGDSVVITFQDIPVAEWAGSGTVNTMSDSVVYQNARMQYTSNAAASYNSGDVVKYEDLVFDTPVAKYSTSTGKYTVPRDGVYSVTASSVVATTLTAAAALRVFKNATFTLQGQSAASGANNALTVTGLVKAVAGDTIEVQIVESNAGTVTMSTDSQNNFLQIFALADYTAGDAVGFGEATQTSLGLVKAGQVPGTNTNDNANEGNAGEYHEGTTTTGTFTSTTTVQNLDSDTLDPGDYEVEAIVHTRANTGGNASVTEFGISLNSASFTGVTFGTGYYASLNLVSEATVQTWASRSLRRRVTVAAGATQTVYLVGFSTWSSGTPQWAGRLVWRRVR